MKTITNRFGELQTNWTSHKHVDNPNFMQVVRYMHIQYKDGRNHLYWSLFNAATNDNHIIPNITLDEAKRLFTDEPIKEVSEYEFKEFMKNKAGV